MSIYYPACWIVFGLGIVVGGIALLSMIPSNWKALQEGWTRTAATIVGIGVKSREARLDADAPNGLFWMSVIFVPVLLLSGIGLGWWSGSDWHSTARSTSS